MNDSGPIACFLPNVGKNGNGRRKQISKVNAGAHPESTNKLCSIIAWERPSNPIQLPAKERYPETALLKQVKCVGGLIATTYVLTLEDPHRFRKSRDAGCFVGLQPGRRNSGESGPQMHTSKEGDEYLRTLLVQGAHYILGPFGKDSDLRRWGQKLAARGGKSGKKTGGGGGSTEASRATASAVGGWRSLRTAAQ